MQLTKRRHGAHQLLVAAAIMAGWMLAPQGVRARDLPLPEPTTLGASAGDGAIARIELPPMVEARHGDVSLGDVAALASSDLSTLRRLMSLPLGRLPRSGESARLDQATLARWIRARTGINPQRIAWSGAEVVNVHLSMHELSGEQLASVAKASLHEWLAARSARSSVELSRTPRDIPVPAGEVRVQVRPISNAAMLTKHMSVWVDVWVDDRFIRTVPVSFEVSAYEQGYVADSAAASGSPLDQVALQPREVDLAVLPSKSVLTGLAPETAANLRLRRTVAAGEVMTRDSIESRPSVTRGDWATLHAVSGAVNLESRVEVLEDGRDGQMVHVKLSNGTVPMLARVVGTRMVEVRQ
ncbi:flagellar basal body P-ring formation chaperone FlgA [Ralstonia sp. A12]|uniref:flagellar basal body P-ring formation chaperone FlgA n=1 Tax=Ralstonia sp. A12 TaxID=1217052 RepID=UPI0018DD8B92|nr:flagellar basal body P-ring formation chaperone FlgA [Ralstonia sp. A12]